MTTRTVYPRTLPELGPDLEQAWWAWLEQHGLPDPFKIPAGGPIICDDTARTITVLRYVCTETGSPAIHPDRVRNQIINPANVVWERNSLVKEWVTVQLEAPALPFPPGYDVEVDDA